MLKQFEVSVCLSVRLQGSQSNTDPFTLGTPKVLTSMCIHARIHTHMHACAHTHTHTHTHTVAYRIIEKLNIVLNVYYVGLQRPSLAVMGQSALGSIMTTAMGPLTPLLHSSFLNPPRDNKLSRDYNSLESSHMDVMDTKTKIIEIL